MTVRALLNIAPLAGSTKPQLMMCDDNHVYVAKMAHSGRNKRELATELMASELARGIGLPVPESRVVVVDPFLIDSSPSLSAGNASGVVYRAGLHFGSRYFDWPSAMDVAQLLPGRGVGEALKRDTLIGSIVFSRWAANRGPMQAIVRTRLKPGVSEARLISFEKCFGGPAWTFTEVPGSPIWGIPGGYLNIRRVDCFEPYLSRFCEISGDALVAIAGCIPSEWYEEQIDLDQLIDSLLARRSKLPGLLVDTVRRNAAHFPNWVNRKTIHLASSSASAEGLRLFA